MKTIRKAGVKLKKQKNKQNSKQNSRQNNKFTIKMQKKLIVLFGMFLIAFVVLGLRLYQINKDKGDQYKKQVLSQRQYDSTTLPYRRGDILDAKGTKLATSEKVYNLVIDSKVILAKEDYMEPTMEALGASFELNMEETREYITTHPSSSYHVPLKQLTYDQISGFLELQENNSKIKGIWFEEEYKRIYPFNSLACDVIGFTGKDNVGTYGMEEFYNDVLNGTTGREYGYLNDDANLERTIKPAVDGYTIHSTIDMNIQSIVEKYLQQFNDEHMNTAREGLGANNLGCIIMEVNTGNVLAMASYPTFDLNNPKDLSPYYTDEQIAAKEAEGVSYYDLLNQLWRNYCISDTYEPGSTAKPFTVAAALEAGAVKGNEYFTCKGNLVRGGHTIRCHNTSGDGAVSVQDAIAWSCNVALMEMAERLGKERFCEFQQIFNFGLKTNIDLAGEARTAGNGLIYTLEDMDDSTLATNSFGQNFNVTMIQMITGYCSLINGGNYYEPHMVDKITNANGATIENIEPRILKQTVSESTSEKIRQYCRATVMEEGGTRRTGKTARPAGYAIGGKTGTAQTYPRGNKEYVVSFIGHAPAEDPQIAIYVVVDRANDVKQDNAKFSTAIVRNILTEVLPYLNIFMTEELSAEEEAELAALQLENTRKYTQTPEGDDLNNADGDDNPEDGQKPGDNPEGQPAWMSYEKDPETGYLIDPDTKELLDPETGDPINGFYSPLDDGIGGPPTDSNPETE